MSAIPYPKPRSPSESDKSEAILCTFSLHKQSLKRLEVPLRKFTKIAVPLHLEILNKHRSNIQKFLRVEDWNSVQKEQINARRTVQQLKSCIHEIDVVRSQVQDLELPKFDKLVKPVKEEALQVIQSFLVECEDCGTSTDSPLPLSVSPKQKTIDDKTCTAAEVQPLIADVVPIQMHVRPQEAPVEVDTSWMKLKEDLVELNDIIHGFSDQISLQQESVDLVEENVETARDNVIEGTKKIALAAKLRPVILPLAGAVLGTCVAGPVGLLTGFKLGGVAAAVGGGLLGFQSGRLIKKKIKTKVDLELDDLKKIENSEIKTSSHSMPDLRETPET